MNPAESQHSEASDLRDEERALWGDGPDEPPGDICGLCGEPGADKMALWTGGGVYWPGETIPETEMVHQECEREETGRAFAALTPEQRRAALR